jgi:hypothetical protein
MRTKNYKMTNRLSKTESIINNGLQGVADGLTAAANYVGFGNTAATAASNWLTGKKSKSQAAPASQYPIPKLTLDVKFYRMDEIAGL